MTFRPAYQALAASALTLVLASCGGGTSPTTSPTTPPTDSSMDIPPGDGAVPENLPDRETIYRTSTVADLVALGARKLTEADFRSEIVGKRLWNAGDVDDGPRTDGWIWKISADGTARSQGAKGRLESEGGWTSTSTWTFENGQYCRPGCSTVYELNGVYRFTESEDPDNLTGWSIEIGGWDAGELLYDGETLTARNLSAMRLAHEEGSAELIDPVDFSIRRTESVDYVVTLDGFEHIFTRDQRTATGAEGPRDAMDIAFSVYGGTRRDFHENLDNGHSGGNHVTIWGASRDHEGIEGSDPWLRTFATFGNPTTDFSRLDGMTATYSGGWAWLESYVSSFEAGNFD